MVEARRRRRHAHAHDHDRAGALRVELQLAWRLARVSGDSDLAQAATAADPCRSNAHPTPRARIFAAPLLASSRASSPAETRPAGARPRPAATRAAERARRGS